MNWRHHGSASGTGGGEWVTWSFYLEGKPASAGLSIGKRCCLYIGPSKLKSYVPLNITSEFVWLDLILAWIIGILKRDLDMIRWVDAGSHSSPNILIWKNTLILRGFSMHSELTCQNQFQKRGGSH